ncbi:MAG TPA: hypothetical protein VLV89_01650 [Candidatus Acidoferrum sp.]|nr:hypothetical protein [Candidatus Acidoferrum sp.]
MPFLLVRHKVSDFDQWKRVFDSHAVAQQRAGLKIIHIMRNVEDPSEVVLFFEAQTIEGARGFVLSPDVPQSKEQSGVTDKPDIYFLT